MSNMLKYKGYCTKPEYSSEDRIFFGKIEGIADLVTFEAERAADIEQVFHEAVDDYLDSCAAVGKNPDKAYQGSFNVRITPSMHRELALFATLHDLTLNDAVKQAIQQFLHPTQATVVNITTQKEAQVFSQQVQKYWDHNTQAHGFRYNQTAVPEIQSRLC